MGAVEQRRPRRQDLLNAVHERDQDMSKPGLGLLLGFEDSMADFVELAREGEAAGMDSMYSVEAGRSAFVSAAAVIAATERVTVGTYIANAYAREPWLTAIAARDLDEMSGGRFTLGLGTGNRHFNDWYMGVDEFRPLGKLRDYIEIVRSAVACRASRRTSAIRGRPPPHPLAGELGADAAIDPRVPVCVGAQDGPAGWRGGRRCRRRRDVVGRVHARHRPPVSAAGRRRSRPRPRQRRIPDGLLPERQRRRRAGPQCRQGNDLRAVPSRAAPVLRLPAATARLRRIRRRRNPADAGGSDTRGDRPGARRSRRR